MAWSILYGRDVYEERKGERGGGEDEPLTLEIVSHLTHIYIIDSKDMVQPESFNVDLTLNFVESNE